MGTPLGTPDLNSTLLASPGQLATEHAVYADFMRTVLEIINTIISTGQAISSTAILFLHALIVLRRTNIAWCSGATLTRPVGCSDAACLFPVLLP